MTTHGRNANTTNAMSRQTPTNTPLVSPDWFKALPKGEGYALLQGAVYKFSVPLLEAPDETVVREAGYRDLLSGDPNDWAETADRMVPSMADTERECTRDPSDRIETPSAGLESDN